MRLRHLAPMVVITFTLVSSVRAADAEKGRAPSGANAKTMRRARAVKASRS